ncbi:hypothetical protein ATJ97_0242 [Georgenia soli]|uniref:Uncharacterized protein n=1 Tax=Georgenia soli TaxID=638953 RepID=A0A2A9F0Y5_9MICO|nr:hypothetical protein [Georgenia soli]PFG44964.1 hypothetical protein ATJ97_0242 [Georgenia soli]
MKYVLLYLLGLAISCAVLFLVVRAAVLDAARRALAEHRTISLFSDAAVEDEEEEKEEIPETRFLDRFRD